MELGAGQEKTLPTFYKGLRNKNSQSGILSFSVGPGLPGFPQLQVSEPLCFFPTWKTMQITEIEMLSCILTGIHKDVYIWGSPSFLGLGNKHLD